MKYYTMNDLVMAVIGAIEEKADGLPVRITGGSAQSCSVYIRVGTLAVRISDHGPRTRLSHADYYIALGDSHGDDVIEVRPVYERIVCEMDDDGEEVLSHESVECEATDDDAEHVGYRVADSEIERAAAAVVAEAAKKK